MTVSLFSVFYFLLSLTHENKMIAHISFTFTALFDVLILVLTIFCELSGGITCI